jgi:hypothetical protein
MSVCVMEDYKLRDLRASHTLEVIGAPAIFKLIRKAQPCHVHCHCPRVRSCLLLIDKARDKDKTYI